MHATTLPICAKTTLCCVTYDYTKKAAAETLVMMTPKAQNKVSFPHQTQVPDEICN